jgi:serine/threonine protein kinase
MIAGKRYHGTQVDIWSCGVILFALICGYLPFEDSNTSMLYKKIIQGEYKCPKFMSEEARDLVARILNTKPEERFTIENIKAHKWYRLVNIELHPGIFIGEDSILIENKILCLLEQYGVSSEVARKHIESNKHNHITTTYYLLLRKHKIQPIKESIDAPRPPNRPTVPKLPVESLKLPETLKIEAKTTAKHPNTARSPAKITNSPRPVVPAKSARSSVSPTRKIEEVKSYSGPYNVECIFAKAPVDIGKSFINALDKLRILYRQNVFAFVCNRGNVKFNAEVVKIQGSAAVYLLKFNDNSSNPKEYASVVEQILSFMNL